MLRSRPPRAVPDAFDLAGLKAVERAALARVPVHAMQIEVELLPATTRAALTTAGPRPPDGTPGGLTPRVRAVAEAALRATNDTELRTPPTRTFRPFLAAPVVEAVRGLPVRARFGRPGSGGPLRTWLRRAHGWGNRTPAAGFHRSLDRWMRGPWAGWLETTLAPARLAAQGLWKPEGVARLVATWRASATGEASRAVFVVATTVAWVDRVRGGGR
ncbi:MAG: asparagine synthase-related protein [Planctomycetota bacterium]